MGLEPFSKTSTEAKFAISVLVISYEQDAQGEKTSVTRAITEDGSSPCVRDTAKIMALKLYAICFGAIFADYSLCVPLLRYSLQPDDLRRDE